MEKTEFQGKCKLLADTFTNKLSSQFIHKLTYKFEQNNRCKNLCILNLSIFNGSMYEFEIWQPHSGEICWDFRPLHFAGVFA